jgi:hypothetical protein
MPMIQPDDFTKDVIPNGYREEVKEVIVVAAALGWKVHKTGSESLTIISPRPENHPKKYHFSQNRRGTNDLKRIRRDLIRFGDPEKVMIADAAHLTRDPELRNMLVKALPMVGVTEGIVVDDTPEAEEKRTPKPKPEPSKQRAVTIVSQAPMVAKANENRGYDSHTTIERKWSDGTTDYACIEKGCDYTSPNRASVPAHWAKAHHDGGRGRRNPVYVADTSGATKYAPRQTRIDALAQALADAMAAGATDPQTIAREALMWVHEQSKKGTEHAAENEPMDAEAMLDRIRLLLDNGTHLQMRQRVETLEQQMHDREETSTEMRKRLEHAAEQVDAERQLREAAEASAKEAWDNLNALRALLADLPVKDSA